jgi:hypothetical protein
MKLIDAITRPQTVLQFGQAKLLRNLNGRHELVGGSPRDVVAIKEWVSLFAHEIVFEHSKRKPKPDCRAAGRNRIPPFIKQQRTGFFGRKRISSRIRFESLPDYGHWY